jgi:hypothetical protein
MQAEGVEWRRRVGSVCGAVARSVDARTRFVKRKAERMGQKTAKQGNRDRVVTIEKWEGVRGSARSSLRRRRDEAIESTFV